jgi:hypothetical protein
MKSTMLACTLAAAFLAPAAAQAQLLMHTFDISGLEVSPGFGANFPTFTHDFGIAGTVVLVDFAAIGEAVGGSWVSDIQLAIDTDDDLTFDADVGLGDFGGPDSPATFDLSGSLPSASESSNGLVYLTVYDTFNDNGTGLEANILQGFVTVSYQPVPEPSTIALLAGGLIAGVAVWRRR